MSEYQKTKHTNLRRRATNGEYVMFARIKGKLHYEGLDTTDESMALRRRDERCAEIRRAMGVVNLNRETETLRQSMQAYLDRMTNDLNYRHEPTKLTIAYNTSLIKTISKKFSELKIISKSTKLITGEGAENDLTRWAKQFRKDQSDSRYNHALGLLRRIFNFAIERGVRYDNPAEKLKRIRETPKIPVVPTTAQFHDIVRSIRKSGHRASVDAADAAEFLAFGGYRINEAWNIEWADVDETWDNNTGRIHVRVVKGLTRGSKPRFVPMNADMRNLIARIKLNREAGQVRVLRVKEFDKTLTTACKKVGVQRFTHHTLRHFFATRSIESGVDIPTVSKWLGHQDGGALAMKTYGHLRDDHSSAMAAKVSFAVDAKKNASTASAKDLWVRPMGIDSRYIPTGVRALQRITATGELVYYAKTNGVPKRTALGTWDLEEAKRLLATSALE